MLGGHSERFTSHHECAVLSQRLALDINGTTSGFMTIYDMADKAQLQIQFHARLRSYSRGSCCCA